jgi:hypothetical protein
VERSGASNGLPRGGCAAEGSILPHDHVSCRLQSVRVLIFVDQHVVEAAADIVGQAGVPDHLRPVEEQIIVVEHVLLLLRLDIRRE